MGTKTEIVRNTFIGEEMTKITHASGLMIYVIKKEFKSAYAIFGTRYGSFDNEFVVDGENITVPHGIAHFLEHKMFETEDGGDTFEQFAEIGADANAYTSTDRTAYLFSCTEEFYKAFETLVNMVVTPVFTKENVKKEQGIIAQEIKMCEDRPSNTLHYNLMKALYEKNPVRIPIAGTVESISEITAELLYKCYNAFYRMNNMAICVCGDVDSDKILEIVDRYVPSVRESEVEFTDDAESPRVNEALVSEEAEVSKPMFRIGVKFPEGTSENSCACEILWEALFSSCEDFFSDIYENELVSGYRYYYEYSRPCSYFAIGGDSDSPEAVFKKFKEYAAKTVANGVSKEAFERAKRNAYADVIRNFDYSEEIAEGMFESFLVNENYLDIAESYQAVSYDEVQELAKIALSDERFCMSVLYPRAKSPLKGE